MNSRKKTSRSFQDKRASDSRYAVEKRATRVSDSAPFLVSSHGGRTSKET